MLALAYFRTSADDPAHHHRDRRGGLPTQGPGLHPAGLAGRARPSSPSCWCQGPHPPIRPPRSSSEIELEDAIKFFVVAFVILPLLPDQGRADVLNPAKIWLLVVLLTGIGWGLHRRCASARSAGC